MNKSMQLKAKIRNIAVKNRVPAQAVLQNFILERFLERIAVSRYADRFILKGGLLIASLVGIHNRTTMDIDTTLAGYPLTQDAIQRALTDICAVELKDEVTFRLDHILPIREDDEYGGLRGSLIGCYEVIEVPFKLDITTGDAIFPHAQHYAFQSIFEDKTINVWAYQIETILAEKIETILRRGVLNTRLRDFYDVCILAKDPYHVIKKDLFVQALKATQQQRQSIQSAEQVNNILETISRDETMGLRWKRYSQVYSYAANIDFDEVMDVIKQLVPFA